MSQVFTYFHKDGTTEVRVQPEGPLPLKGEVWVRGRYGDDILPSPLNARVGTAGVKVWMAIRWLDLSDHDAGTFRRKFGDILEPEDIDAARWYYDQNKTALDDKLREEAEATAG